MELICLLLIAIYQYEKSKYDPPPVIRQRPIRMVKDYKLQRMVDSCRVSRELNIQSKEDVRRHIEDTGKQMNALRREKARHESSLHRHEEILSAWDAYQNADPTEDDFRQAYAILAQNRILTKEAAENLRQRYRFEQQKVLDYGKRLPELKHRYRTLKELEKMVYYPEWEVEQIRKRFATPEAGEETLEDIIRTARQKKQEKFPEKPGISVNRDR